MRNIAVVIEIVSFIIGVIGMMLFMAGVISFLLPGIMGLIFMLAVSVDVSQN